MCDGPSVCPSTSPSGWGEPDPGLPAEGEVTSCRHHDRRGGEGGAQGHEGGAACEEQHFRGRDPGSMRSRKDFVIFNATNRDARSCNHT